mgnify:CR=1 FL=1
MRNEFLWVEKYAPKTIEECILPEGIKKTFQDFVDRGEISNLLLSGPPGIGKTTLVHRMCKKIGYTLCEFNASHTRSGIAFKKTILPLLKLLFYNHTLNKH